MNSIVIPPSPNWYLPDILACAPDGTLVYGSHMSIVIIKPKPEDQPADIELISFAHHERISSISLNSKWGNDSKLIVSAGEDKVVKVWNCDTLELFKEHNSHTTNETKLIGAIYAGSDKVISVSEDGMIIVWKVSTNELNPITNLFKGKTQVTCLSSCPHAPWLCAFGLRNGLVIIADLRLSGQIKYKLKGHEKQITDLAWCPVPVNIFPKLKTKQITLKDRLQKIYDEAKTENNPPLDRGDGCHINTEETNKTQAGNPPQNELENTNANNFQENTKIEGHHSECANNKSMDPEDVANDKLQIQNVVNETQQNASNVLEINQTKNETQDLNNQLQVDPTKDTDKLPVESISAVNIETQHEQQPDNTVVKTEAEIPNCRSQEEIEEMQKVLEKNRENTLKSSASYTSTKTNPWVNLKYVDDEIQEEKIVAQPQENDFLKECHSLLEKITSVVETEDNTEEQDEKSKKEIKPRRILKARKIKKPEDYAAPSNIEDDLFSNTSQDDLLSNENDESEDKLSTDKNDDDLNKSIEELLEDSGKFKTTLETVTDNLEKMTVGYQKPEGDNKNVQITEVEEEFISEESRKEFLLASVSGNGSIIIWRAGTDGKVQSKLSISSKQKFKNMRVRDRIWMSMCWITPTILLSSGGNGELLQWDLKNYSNGNLKSKIVHGDHHSALFSIAAPIQNVLPIEGGNWREETKSKALTAWTIGQERMLLNTTVDLQRKTVACYPTLGNSVQCLAVSTIDPNKLAIGTADGLIKIWDLSRPHIQYVTMTTFKLKSQSKVLNLSWHPEQEGVLAYGTEEGHIGLINPSCSSKPPTLLVHYFRNSIYKLEWGPLKSKENHGLYSCSEGVLILYDTKNPLENPTVIQTPDGKYITQFSWKQDYSLLALGTKDGTIILFSHDLDYQMVLFYQQKAIVSLFWHPQATADDEEVSPYQFWLASSSSDGAIVVYDMKNCTDEVEVSTRVVTELKDHTKFIRAMSWSPHEGGKLVSASEDGLAHIWDVKNKVVLSTYLNSYCQPITACTWSPLDRNYVILGGRQCTLQIINVNDYKPISKADVQKELNKRKKKLLSKSSKEEQKTVEVSIVKKNVNCRDLILSSVSNLQSDKDSLLKDCQQLMALNDISSNVDRSKSQVLQLFGGQEDVHKLIHHQQELHASKSKHTLNHHLSLWKGDIGESIKKAMNEGQLSPWLISMAPMVSPSLWQEACESYAGQLTNDPNGDVVQAASYYLSCHKIEKAVEVLCTKKLFKEALVLAKCRLPNEKGIIEKIILDWAMFYIVNGSYEVSAQCYIALEKYEEAAKALYKRCDLEILSLAIELAEKSKNSEMINAIKFRYNSFKTQNESESSKATRDKTSADNQLPTRIEAVLAREDGIEKEDSDKTTETDVASKLEALLITANGDDVDEVNDFE